MDQPISIVCWKWRPVDGKPNTKKRGTFTSAHVNALYMMIKANTTVPFRFICVTDDFRGVKKEIECVRLWTEFRNLGGCFSRLVCFKRDFTLFGDKFISIDLDCVITGNIDHILKREEDFVVWEPDETQLSRRVSKYCGSMWLLKAGAHPEVYDTFDPERVDDHRRKKVYVGGTDQRQISACIENASTFSQKDGVYNFIPDFGEDNKLPEDASILFFNGPYLPDDRGLLDDFSWIKEHYPLAGQGEVHYNHERLLRKRGKIVQEKKKKHNENVDITFILYWWGGWPQDQKDMGPTYIRRLVLGINKYVPSDYKFRIVLFTDKGHMRFDGVDTVKLRAPKLRWNLRKMFMFSEEAGIKSPAICIDLDAIIVGDLSPLIRRVTSMPKSHLLYTCAGAYNPTKMGGSVVGFKPKDKLEMLLWDPLLDERQYPDIERETKGSERKYYQRQLKPMFVRFWNDMEGECVLSYKKDCQKELPDGASIVRFHGKPRPHQVQSVSWIKEYWR